MCCVADEIPLSGDTSCWERAGVHASDDGADVACPVSLIEWFLNFYKDTQKGPVRPLEGICRAGEVLFVPRGWWHMALNLEVGHMSAGQLKWLKCFEEAFGPGKSCAALGLCVVLEWLYVAHHYHSGHVRGVQMQV